MALNFVLWDVFSSWTENAFLKGEATLVKKIAKFLIGIYLANYPTLKFQWFKIKSIVQITESSDLINIFQQINKQTAWYNKHLPY